MSERVSTDDLADAEMALRHEADTYDDPTDAPAPGLIRVAEWIYRERQRRYRQMAYRAVPDPLGFRQMSARADLLGDTE